MDISQLETLQKELAKKVIIPDKKDSYYPHDEDIIFSLDVQYVEEQAYIALDAQRWNGEHLGIFVSKQTTDFPYIPQFFSFREAPILLSVINLVKEKYDLIAALLLIDGHGIAHPRRFGVASLVGVEANLPTVGCAKEPLLRYEGNLSKQRGNYLPILLENEEVGRVLCSQKDTKPVFVSAGHLIDLSVACEVVLGLSTHYRISEPLRRADQAARAFAKGEKNIPPFSIYEV
jgi:deoxyribonuclease V